MTQLSFSSLEFSGKKKQTKRDVFDLLPRNSHVVGLGPFGEHGHEAEAF